MTTKSDKSKHYYCTHCEEEFVCGKTCYVFKDSERIFYLHAHCIQAATGAASAPKASLINGVKWLNEMEVSGNGDCHWYSTTVRTSNHRLDGPAIERADGCDAYYINGVSYQKKRWEEEIEKMNKWKEESEYEKFFRTRVNIGRA